MCKDYERLARMCFNLITIIDENKIEYQLNRANTLEWTSTLT